MLTAQNVAAALRAAAQALDGMAAPAAPLAAAPISPPPAPQSAVPQVNADQVTALIMPHVDNPAIKGALGEAMRALGVNALAEAPEHLYGQLYTAFQGVLARFGIGGAAPQSPPPPPAAVSII